MILIGHNGAGKSTLIQYILGLYTKVSQHPYLEHISQHIKPLQRNDIGYSPEAALLDDNMSANDYYRLIAGLRDIETYDLKHSMNEVALSVDINMALKHYSKGMKQRLLLALALMGNPEKIILDEPTSGLDPFGQEAIESLLKKIKKNRNLEMILSTHSLKLAFDMNDEIWILKEGKIVYKGIPNSLAELESLFNQYRPEELQ